MDKKMNADIERYLNGLDSELLYAMLSTRQLNITSHQSLYVDSATITSSVMDQIMRLSTLLVLTSYNSKTPECNMTFKKYCVSDMIKKAAETSHTALQMILESILENKDIQRSIRIVDRAKAVRSGVSLTFDNCIFLNADVSVHRVVAEYSFGIHIGYSNISNLSFSWVEAKEALQDDLDASESFSLTTFYSNGNIKIEGLSCKTTLQGKSFVLPLHLEAKCSDIALECIDSTCISTPVVNDVLKLRQLFGATLGRGDALGYEEVDQFIESDPFAEPLCKLNKVLDLAVGEYAKDYLTKIKQLEGTFVNDTFINNVFYLSDFTEADGVTPVANRYLLTDYELSLGKSKLTLITPSYCLALINNLGVPDECYSFERRCRYVKEVDSTAPLYDYGDTERALDRVSGVEYPDVLKLSPYSYLRFNGKVTHKLSYHNLLLMLGCKFSFYLGKLD